MLGLVMQCLLFVALLLLLLLVDAVFVAGASLLLALVVSGDVCWG